MKLFKYVFSDGTAIICMGLSRYELKTKEAEHGKLKRKIEI